MQIGQWAISCDFVLIIVCCLDIGSFEGMLRVYSPKARPFKTEDMVFEKNVGQPILQLAVGRYSHAAD